MDIARQLASLGLEEWTDPQQQPRSHIRVWASEPEEPANAIARYRAGLRQLGTNDQAFFLASEYADVPVSFGLDERIEAFYAARNGSPVGLSEPSWLDKAMRSLSENEVVAAVRSARRPASQRLDHLVPVIPAGEGMIRVVAHEGLPAWGPLPLGWLWTPQHAASLAVLWEKWAAEIGFRPVVVGTRSVYAYVARRPTEPSAIRDLTAELLTVCPAFAVDGGLAVDALATVLSEGWLLGWD